MTRHETFPLRLSTDKPIAIAILAMGGQGGGVLADWIVAAAEHSGWIAQSTSVPGVAQRTGATIYYIEILPVREGAEAILSLMPTPGDVDVVLAAEFMEAGRSILRGLVTPERTTLITSTHRSFAVGEKEKPGDGIGDPLTVVEAAGIAAKRIIAFDMQSLAETNGSVISATMFGALAGADVLPFDVSAYEAAISAGGKGVAPSLKAFHASYLRTREEPRDPVVPDGAKVLPVLPAATGHAALDALLVRIRAFPESAHAMLFAGVKKLVDYQDPAYANEYLDRMDEILRNDIAHGGAAKDHAFTQSAAKYLAVSMAYDDVIRVADLKTRASRFDRVKKEVGVKDDQLIYTTEYMHPRMEEVTGTMPASLGRFIESRPALFKALDKVVNRGRRVKTGTIGWFLTLYVLAAMKGMRRRALRHGREMAHLQHWLDTALTILPRDYDLAVEVLNSRRLVKGYSDTHARGQSKFDRVLAAAPMLIGKPDGAVWMQRLRQAALLDEDGTALDGAFKTIESIYA
ncbi:indolepyruvate oxidoreductase subunit beta family protein [Microvirga antarctica]|uniref:indolepyruvate oxidoreductase subunit beta family protein n=1 Tax=Microvirga antarctica TaxID=2819233 RepID=UPI001B30F949|nr:indolepyruvate oxidoreductase subunit beta family protein [Microvirga antarctica]